MLSSLNKLSESDPAAGKIDSMEGLKFGTVLLMTKLLGWDCLVLERKTPKEDEKFVVLLLFSELFVSDFVGGKIDGIKEEKRWYVSLEAELPDRELAAGNNECTGGAECGTPSRLCELPGGDLAGGNKEDMQRENCGTLFSLAKLPD